MKFVGIDPGSRVLGYAVLNLLDGGVKLHQYGTIQLNEIPHIAGRLQVVVRHLRELFEQSRPDQLAIEEPFVSLNPRSAMLLGQVVGAVKVVAAECGIDVFSYSPREVKKTITGYGGAGKEQVRQMVCRFTGSNSQSLTLDESDAVAVALCHIMYTKRVRFR